jgi:hypothetical protein
MKYAWIAWIMAVATTVHAQQTPRLTLPGATNPLVMVVDSPPVTVWPHQIGLHVDILCTSGTTTKDPILVVGFQRDGLVTTIVADEGTELWDGGNKGICGRIRSQRGDIAFRLIDSGKTQHRITLQVAIANEPVRLPPNLPVMTIDADLKQPLFTEVAIDERSLTSSSDPCLHFAYAPSLLIKHSGGPIEAVRLSLVGGAPDAEINVVGPIDQMRASGLVQSPRCASQQSFAPFTLKDGTYAVYLGYLGGKPFHDPAWVIARRDRAQTDPFAVILPVHGSSLAQRAARQVLPLIDNWPQYFSRNNAERDKMFGALIDHYPPAALVFAAHDLQARGVKKDEPIILVSLAGDVAKAATLDGTELGIASGDLAIAPSGPPVFPVAARDEDLAFSDARELAGPEDAAATAAFDKATAKYEACADKIWKKMVGDLPYDYDLLIVHGTHTDSVRTMAQKKIDSACGGPKMAKVTEAYLASLRKSRDARRLAHIKGLAERFARK